MQDHRINSGLISTLNPLAVVLILPKSPKTMFGGALDSRFVVVNPTYDRDPSRLAAKVSAGHRRLPTELAASSAVASGPSRLCYQHNRSK